LEDADIVPADVVYERVVTENAMIHHNDEQTWHYLADQEASEALIFRAADSSTNTASRKSVTSVCWHHPVNGGYLGCAHGSFRLPGAAEGPPRESIDVRVLVMHADIEYPTAADWFT
jgi:hypothetical protein